MVQPLIIGIDPSYTRTGLSFYHGPNDFKLYSISHSDNKMNISICLSHAYQIARDIKTYIKENTDDLDSVIIGCEYPIFATTAGSYLGLITAKIDSLFRSIHPANVYYLPSVAIKCYTGTRTKTDLVNWIKAQPNYTKFRGNHDEGSALILGELAYKSHIGEYKKSFFNVNYSKK